MDSEKIFVLALWVFLPVAVMWQGSHDETQCSVVDKFAAASFLQFLALFFSAQTNQLYREVKKKITDDGVVMPDDWIVQSAANGRSFRNRQCELMLILYTFAALLDFWFAFSNRYTLRESSLPFTIPGLFHLGQILFGFVMLSTFKQNRMALISEIRQALLSTRKSPRLPNTTS